ncbi:MAG: leucine-rich repeat protein [Christensenellales bacterium]|jgi:hypothetical protein
MKRKLARILSFALLALLLASAVAPSLSPALAEEDFMIENGVLIGYLGEGGNVKIPNGVTEIGRGAFAWNTGITSVTIPKGVSEIGNSAFDGCSSLKTITLPDSVTTIGARVFRSCESLTRITIPRSVTAIGDRAFADCFRLTRISVPGTVKTINEYTFSNCVHLTQVSIGNGVQTIGHGAFDGCRSLTEVVLPNSLQAINNGAFYDCTALTGIVLPDSVETIGASAFGRCPYLRVVTAPKGISEEDVRNAAPNEGLEILRLPDDLLPPALYLQVGQTMVLPKFKGAKVAWSVQGDPVITIGKGNRLKGVQAGEAVLKLNVLAAIQGKALTLNGEPLNPDKTYEIPLKVFKKTDAVVKKVSVSAKGIIMHPTGYGYPAVKQIYFAFTPASLTGNADWKGNCLFVSSNPNVAQVNQEGKIFAIRPGKATITVYAPNLKTAKVSVTVKGLITSLKLKDDDGNYVKKVTLSLYDNKYIWLNPEFNADAAFTALYWTSSNPDVAVVTKSGMVVAASKGTTKITATAMDGSGKKATVTVTVTEPPEAP